MAVQATPTGIHIDTPGREMRVTWSDGHASAYSFDLLRKECPCATCNEEREQRKREAANPLSLKLTTKPILRAGEAMIEDATPVGRYAIQFRWNDRHETGIYTWDFLRGLCPCDGCARSRSAIPR
jgi:DUF971 family protein